MTTEKRFTECQLNADLSAAFAGLSLEFTSALFKNVSFNNFYSHSKANRIFFMLYQESMHCRSFTSFAYV